MMVDPRFRRSSIGRTLLINFEQYLIQHDLKNTFCLPFPHLKNFYGIIGFKKVLPDQVPEFLKKRMQELAITQKKAIEEELTWLNKLSLEGLHVPRPVKNKKAQLVEVASHLDVPKTRNCSLMK